MLIFWLFKALKQRFICELTNNIVTEREHALKAAVGLTKNWSWNKSPEAETKLIDTELKIKSVYYYQRKNSAVETQKNTL